MLLLNQAPAYLHDQPLYCSVDKTGVVLASVYDYVFRPTELDDVEPICSTTRTRISTITTNMPKLSPCARNMMTKMINRLC